MPGLPSSALGRMWKNTLTSINESHRKVIVSVIILTTTLTAGRQKQKPISTMFAVATSSSISNIRHLTSDISSALLMGGSLFLNTQYLVLNTLSSSGTFSATTGNKTS